MTFFLSFTSNPPRKNLYVMPVGCALCSTLRPQSACIADAPPILQVDRISALNEQAQTALNQAMNRLVKMKACPLHSESIVCLRTRSILRQAMFPVLWIPLCMSSARVEQAFVQIAAHSSPYPTPGQQRGAGPRIPLPPPFVALACQVAHNPQ